MLCRTPGRFDLWQCGSCGSDLVGKGSGEFSRDVSTMFFLAPLIGVITPVTHFIGSMIGL